jgi:hypothetical protein
MSKLKNSKSDHRMTTTNSEHQPNHWEISHASLSQNTHISAFSIPVQKPETDLDSRFYDEEEMLSVLRPQRQRRIPERFVSYSEGASEGEKTSKRSGNRRGQKNFEKV